MVLLATDDEKERLEWMQELKQAMYTEIGGGRKPGMVFLSYHNFSSNFSRKVFSGEHCTLPLSNCTADSKRVSIFQCFSFTGYHYIEILNLEGNYFLLNFNGILCLNYVVYYIKLIYGLLW